MDDQELTPPPRTMRKKKEPFSKEDDTKLRDVIASLGQLNWTAIAEHLPGRSPRQCRERWKLYLSPDINLEPWSLEDEQRLLKMYFTVGPKWTLISKTFPNRTANNIKNKVKQALRRIQKLYHPIDQPQLTAPANQPELSLPEEQPPPA
jgi:hypothetical protein